MKMFYYLCGEVTCGFLVAFVILSTRARDHCLHIVQ